MIIIIYIDTLNHIEYIFKAIKYLTSATTKVINKHKIYPTDYPEKKIKNNDTNQKYKLLSRTK